MKMNSAVPARPLGGVFLRFARPCAGVTDGPAMSPPVRNRIEHGWLTLAPTRLGRRTFVGNGAVLPLVFEACCAVLALGVVAAKWAIMGRFRPFEHPLLTPFVWRLEFVNALYEFLVTPLALEALQGTPFLPWYYRLLGARIGRRTYFHTTGLIEFDLVEVGDEAVVNEDCVLQTHLFEDRVLKADKLRVGHRCTMGAGAVVLYDSEMGDGSSLDALSLLMKGEVLPAGTSWEGSPARRKSRTVIANETGGKMPPEPARRDACATRRRSE